MFEEFLFLLRRSGLNVSLTEWMSLIEALNKGLHGSSFTGFYPLCRALLVKSGAEFDLFDRIFLAYFQKVPLEQEVSQELLDWLGCKDIPMGLYDEQQAEWNESLSDAELETMLRERRSEQREQHNRGSYWIGTHGMSVFGNTGLSPRGIRVGGDKGYRRAIRVAGERRFRDFREDSTLDLRQFQLALKRLRQYSGTTNLPATDFDVDDTIQHTAKNAGRLTVKYRRPRQNTIKVLLLIDSGGSMDYYAQLISALFQAVSKTHFHDLKTYYFHNCIYTKLYTDPTIDPRKSVPTEWLLSNLSGDYKTIFVGDAQMAPYELKGKYHGSQEGKPSSGLDWLYLFRDRYRYAVWFNPGERPDWGEYWSQSYDMIAKLFPMFPLTLDGLEEGMKKLLAR